MMKPKKKVIDAGKTDFSKLKSKPKTTKGATVTQTDKNGKVTTRKITLAPSSIEEAMKKGGIVSKNNKKKREQPRGY